MSRDYIYSAGSLMHIIEVNRLADLLHSIGFRANTMSRMLLVLLPGEQAVQSCPDCQADITDEQMAFLDRAMIEAGFTVRTAEFQLINDYRPWQDILAAIIHGRSFSLPEPAAFVPPQLEICR